MEKPKSMKVIGRIIYILGILFALLFIALILGKTVLTEKLLTSLGEAHGFWVSIFLPLLKYFRIIFSFIIQIFSFESFVLFMILLFFRAAYHIVMGLAIVRGQNWGRMWFLWLSLAEIMIGLFNIDLLDAARAVIFLIFLYFLTRPKISAYCGQVTVPYKYTFRSLFARPLTTLMTILGISLVSFMFCGVLMLADGIAKVLVSTGEKDNVIFMEKDKFSTVESMLSPDEVDMIENLGFFAVDPDLGEQLFSPELVAGISVPSLDDTTKLKNITMRGVVEIAPKLRRKFKLVDGEMYEMGLPTCIVGKTTARKMAHCQLGDSINVSGDYFQVVGIFETGGSTYDSEVWADIYSLRDSYNRAGVAGSIVLARLENAGSMEELNKALEDKPDLEVRVFGEGDYYAQQSEGMSAFLKYLGIFICTVFAMGATIGAMITMYSAVANRTNEIATMRSLGFQGEGIQAAFLLESVLIGAIGAVLGIAVASILSTFEIQMFSTFNFFGEFYLKMTLTMLTVLYTFIFAISMGFVGGVFPSIKATSMKIVDAFR